MKNRNIELIEVHDRRDYISMDHKSAISAEGVIFRVGDEVYHDGDSVRTGSIRAFRLDYSTMDVIAETNNGWSRIVFLSHEN